MNLQSRLEQFRGDNPYDNDTQAKRLLATDDKDLITYVLALGLATAKTRQRHAEREYIKNIGAAPPKERLTVGRVTGSVVKIVPGKKSQNALRQYILEVWRVGEKKLGNATDGDLAVAIKRESASSDGHDKNAKFYANLKKQLGKGDKVRDKWDENSVRTEIETVYGEFRQTEAA